MSHWRIKIKLKGPDFVTKRTIEMEGSFADALRRVSSECVIDTANISVKNIDHEQLSEDWD